MEISLVLQLFKFKITNNKNEKSVFGKKNREGVRGGGMELTFAKF
jgi:hypothetical protein